MVRIFFALALSTGIAMGCPAQASDDVGISRSVYLERAEMRSGRKVRALHPATTLEKGDRVVLMLHWRTSRQDRDFIVSSPIPRDLAFRRSGGENAQVSIDGGRSWGELGHLRKGANLATPEDVTHLRWHVTSPRASSGRGTVSFAAVVR